MTNVEATGKPAAVSAHARNVASKKTRSKKGATQQKAAAKAARKATATRAESKGARILKLIRRPKGATLAAIMRATGWQSHSVRGFMSGIVRTKMGLAVTSTKDESGERSYSVKP